MEVPSLSMYVFGVQRIYLRNTETCNSQSSNEITSKLSPAVTPSPFKNGEDGLNAQDELSIPGLILEMTQRIISKECFFHSGCEFPEEVLLRGNSHLVKILCVVHMTARG